MNAYTGKSLHVAIEPGEMEPYAIFTNDGDAPIARCVDRGTAHLFAAAPLLAEVLRNVLRFEEARTGQALTAHDMTDRPWISVARAVLAKAGVQ